MYFGGVVRFEHVFSARGRGCCVLLAESSTTSLQRLRHAVLEAGGLANFLGSCCGGAAVPAT